MLGICIGVAATLAWQAYGQATKQIIATSAPELGWSPEAKQTIASWVEQLSWKPAGAEIATARPSVSDTAQAATVAPTTPAPKAPIAASLNPQQVQQLVLDVAAVRQSVEQVAASQTKMAGEIDNLLVTDMEIFLKIPTPPQHPAAMSQSRSPQPRRRER